VRGFLELVIFDEVLVGQSRAEGVNNIRSSRLLHNRKFG